MSGDSADEKTARERRGAERRRVLKAGIIAFNGRHSTLPCTVRDLSETGARIAVTGTVSAPDTFELIIELDGIEASCEVVLRRPNEVRVRFSEPPRTVAPRRIQVVGQSVSAKAAASIRRKPKPSTGW